MMLAALLLAAAAPQSAVDAERAFASLAQTVGQWTAFRQYAADDAFMFVPEPVNAQEFLKGRKDPPASVMWWPAEAFVSCDGKTAVTTGPWLRNGGKASGYFTTVWQLQPDGSWKWVMDHGDDLTQAKRAGERPQLRRASCRRAPASPVTADATDTTAGVTARSGASADGSLTWSWTVRADNSRTFSARLWNGRRHAEVLTNEVAAPAE